DPEDAGGPVRAVRAGHTAGVERPHRQLRARLADRLCSHDPDRVTDLAQHARAQERAVAGLADADLTAALEHRADRHARRSGGLAKTLEQLGEEARRDLGTLLADQRLAGLAVLERLHPVAGE